MHILRGGRARNCIAVAAIGVFAAAMPLLSGCGKSAENNNAGSNACSRADSIIARLDTMMRYTALGSMKMDSLKTRIGVLNRKIDTLNKKNARYEKEKQGVAAELKTVRTGRDAECARYIAKKVTKEKMKHDMDAAFANEDLLKKESGQESEEIRKGAEEIKKLRNDIKAMAAELDSLEGRPGHTPGKIQKPAIAHHQAPVHKKGNPAQFKYKH